MNKKGFASSTIIYGLLSVFLIAISILICTMNSNVRLNRSLNEKTVENIEYGTSSINELENRITELENKINKLETKSILEETYPVGSIYICTSSTNPGEIFGGEWQSYATGRTLVGINTSDLDFNEVEKTGGEKTHTLTISEMPNHTHEQYDHLHILGAPNNGAGTFTGWVFDAYAVYKENVNAITTSSNSAYNIPTGGSTAHNNLQPYITVYMWKRTK